MLPTQLHKYAVAVLVLAWTLWLLLIVQLSAEHDGALPSSHDDLLRAVVSHPMWHLGKGVRIVEGTAARLHGVAMTSANDSAVVQRAGRRA